MIKTQSQRIVVIISYILFAIVVVRGVLQYGGSADLAEGLVPLAIFFLLLVTEPSVSRRWGVSRGVYFGLQTALVLRVGFVAPAFEFLWTLYIILGIYASVSFTPRTAAIAIGVLIVIAGLFLITALGAAQGLAILLNLIAVSYFLVSFTQVSGQAEVARNESAALLNDLQKAHAQLQEYAHRAEGLSAVQERNRVAFKINFVASVDKGELEAHAKIIHKGSKTAVGDVEVVNEQGKLVPKLVATYSIQRSDERHGRPP